MAKRPPIPPDVLAKLIEFYQGKVCVITRAEHPRTNHWSHVNEIAQDNLFENIVPLRADLNHALLDVLP